MDDTLTPPARKTFGRFRPACPWRCLGGVGGGRMAGRLAHSFANLVAVMPVQVAQRDLHRSWGRRQGFSRACATWVVPGVGDMV